MKAYLAFCKKEFTESLRTNKLVIMLVAFALFGVMSPMFAKMLPVLLNGIDIGMTLHLPEPTALDSWAQFFKNIGQMGVLVLVIVFSGVTAHEFSKGTLVNILTKGMKRRTVIFSKFTVAAMIWMLSYLLCLGITCSYTAYFWEIEPLPHAFLAFASPCIYGLFLISLMILGGVWFGSFLGTLTLTGSVIIVMSLLSIHPDFQKYNPLSLSGGAIALLNEQKTPDDFIPALMICLVLTALNIAGTVMFFNRKQV